MKLYNSDTNLYQVVIYGPLITGQKAMHQTVSTLYYVLRDMLRITKLNSCQWGLDG